MNEREQAKANLNRQLEREGGLQRAGMRKCVIREQRRKDLSYRNPIDLENLKFELEKEDEECLYYVTKEPLYFHGFVPENRMGGEINTVAILEQEDGYIFKCDTADLQFIT